MGIEHSGIFSKASSCPNITSSPGVDKEYAELVKRACNQKLPIIISNSTIKHAEVLTKYLIGSSNKKVRIYTGQLSESFYLREGILSEIKNATRREVSIEILFQNLPSDEQVGKLIEILRNPMVTTKFCTCSKENHFLISDDHGYRIEQKHNPLELALGIIKAEACFNDPKKCQKYVEWFDNKFKGFPV